MRPGKRKAADADAGGVAARQRTPAQPGRRSAPAVQPGKLGYMPLLFWYNVTMLVIGKERWALWRFLLHEALVTYAEGPGYILEVESAPDACAFNKTGISRDVRLRVQLSPTEGGGALSGCSASTKRHDGAWTIALDDADARERCGVTLPMAATLKPDMPSYRKNKIWHCAVAHDARGRITETAQRTLPELIGLAIADEQER